jgi:hypothetical protein
MISEPKVTSIVISNLPYVDAHYHAVQSSYVTVSQAFSCKSLGNSIAKQVAVILHIHYCTSWQELNMKSPLLNPKDTAMILPVDGCVFNFLGGGNPLCCHSMLDYFDSRAK